MNKTNFDPVTSFITGGESAMDLIDQELKRRASEEEKIEDNP